MPANTGLPTLRRRTVLKTVGGAAVVPALGSVTSAQGGPCPDCPEGTDLLAKYEFNEETSRFEFEKGVCENPLTIDEIEYKEEEDPISVSFTSNIYALDVVVKWGPECEFASDENEARLTVEDGDKDSDGFQYTISVPEDANAISHFSVCTGVCIQVDFIVGEVADDPSEYNFGDELISVNWETTAGDVDRTDGDRDDRYPWTDSHVTTTDGDVIRSDDVLFDGVSQPDGVAVEDYAEVTFDLELNSDDVTLTLVSYAATCPPYFEEDTAYIQDQYAAKTQTFTESNEYTLQVDVPELDQLDELCQI